MATLPGIKYDDDLPGLSAHCFPVRPLLRQNVETEADGAWLVAHRAEQRKRFKAILCTKPKTYARIKEERRRAEKQGTTISEQNLDDDEEEEKDVPILDGFFLMRHCCVEDPSDLCSVNISGKEIQDVKEEDLALFDNVAYVNASENFLPFEAFRGFPILRELEMPLNGLRNIKPNLEDYATLEVLDVSYNNLSHEDILTIGLLSNLKVLHLTGNGLSSLPPNLAMPHIDENTNKEIMRFSKLEILLLDDNRLEEVSVFAALAGLSRLKHLNMEKNELYYVPMLKSVEGKVIPNEDEKDIRKLRRSAEKGGRKSSARGMRSKDVTPRVDTSRVDQTSKAEAQKKLEKMDTIEAPKSTPVPPENTTDVADQKDATKVENGATQAELLNENLEDLTRQVTDIDLAKEVSLDLDGNEKKGTLGDGSGLPPFPDLRVLNLAYNKVEEEEALLAVAAWPMLVELIIHNNPLTTENSGDPPLLQRFLGDRLGIKIKRKKEVEVVKPPVEVKMKRSRHVTSVVPKIPKLSVDDLLMLEAPRPPSQPKPEKTRTQSNLGNQKGPLPPISGSPTGQGQSPGVEREKTQPGKEEDEVTDEAVKPPTQQEGDAFFMTQVEDQDEEAQKKAAPKKKKASRKKTEESVVDDKYKGYEVLLDAEEDQEYMPPKDMQGNIKALKYALGHELVYRDPAARLDRISKPVEPYRRTDQLKTTPRVTQGQKKEQMLTEMKDLVTTEEAELADVISGKDKKLRKRFPESDRLLTEIQRRYNAVRVNSMKEARDARKMLAGTLHDVSKTKEGQRVTMNV